MATAKCPYCGGERTHNEKRRKNPQNAGTLGSWRIPYGLVFGSLALFFGLAMLAVMSVLPDPFLRQLAMILAVLSFVLAAFILAPTIVISRWQEHTYTSCRDCGHRWLVDAEATTSSARIR